jgi:8-oxo-dGTP pyrophosphatase MutT (NUDIX family)
MWACLFNVSGQVLIGRRFRTTDRKSFFRLWWQMPQGSIDAEKIARGSVRELWEETGVVTPIISGKPAG